MPSDDEEEEAIYYEDFFDKPTKEPVKKHSDVKDPKEDEELDEKEHDSAMDKVKLDLLRMRKMNRMLREWEKPVTRTYLVSKSNK